MRCSPPVMGATYRPINMETYDRARSGAAPPDPTDVRSAGAPPAVWSRAGLVTATEPGLARSPGLSYQDLLDADTHPVPDVLRLQSPRYLGSEDIPVEPYT